MQVRNPIYLLNRSLPRSLPRPPSYRCRCRYTPLQLQPGHRSSRLLSTLPNLPLFRALRDHDRSSTAVVHTATAHAFTYGDLVADVIRSKEELLRTAAGVAKGMGTDDLGGKRIAFLAENSYDYVGTVFLFLCSVS